MVITNGSDSEGDDAYRITKVVRKDYFPPNFKKYMLEEQLKWSRHEDPIVRSVWGWVFWSQQDHEIEPSLSLDNCAGFNRAAFNSNVCAIPKVRDNIRRALQKLVQLNIKPLLNFNNCLVQFWAATKTLEGRTKLTTQYQPFALGISWRWDAIDRHHFCEYRMRMCREYNCFYADAESGEEQLGIPGRVFLHKSPEITPDVKLYSEKEYPQRNLALVCGIEESWALPVFERSSQTCVGVLEMVASYCRASEWQDESFLHMMRDIFQEFGLICLDGYTHYEMQVSGNLCSHAPWSQRVNLGMRILSKREAALEELDMVLTLVCVIHELPLALTWIPCNSCNGLIRGQFMSEVLEYVEDTDEEDFLYSNEESFIAEFSQASKFTHLRKGGVSERALSSPSMLYCPDITQLSIAEYPFVHYARLCKLSGLFTICLQSNYTEKEVYVVEFFLSTSSKGDENILTTLSLILGTMEKNFKTFKFASGQQLGEVSSAEVMGFQNGQKLPFVQMIQAPRLSPSPEILKDRGLMLQLGQLDQPSTDAIHSGMNVISEEQSYILPSLQALQNGEATMQLDSPHQPPLDASNNGHNVVIAEENVVVVASLEEGKRKKQREHKGTGVRIEVSLDAIIKCAEMKMKRKGAAEKLKVSTSTFKRACREYGIDRWPPRNVENVGPFCPPPVGNQVQTPQLNSNLPSNQAAPGVTHKNSGFQDANRVTIRAKYRNKTIKFRLSFSSRLVEFQQEVTKRLNLEFGTYYAEYKDAEGELIFIACDDDLQDCLQSSRSQGNASIEVLLKLKEPLFDLNPAN